MQLTITNLGIFYCLITLISYTSSFTTFSSSLSFFIQLVNISIVDEGVNRDKKKKRGENEKEEVFIEK